VSVSVPFRPVGLKEIVPIGTSTGMVASDLVMTEPGPAQLELIRRYARTMRELHADAMAARGPRIGAREARRAVPKADPLRQAAKTMSSGGGTPGPAR
jgi:hypothetical protein